MAADQSMEVVLEAGRPDRATLVMFVLLVVIGGSNAVAVRFSNVELPPFWGAGARFAAAALVFWLIVAARSLPVPRGRTLGQISIYGLLSVGSTYALLYWGLLQVSAGLTMTILAFVPLLTFFLAILHRQETFRWQGLLGALISLAGILIAVRSRLDGGIHIPSVLAVALAAGLIAESSVYFKTIPRTDPIVTNAVATTGGSIFLLIVSWLAGEAWSAPAAGGTWTAYLYLVLIGTVGLFYLYLFVLTRWTASATSYAFLLFPVSTVVIAALIAGETITADFAAGVMLVMSGVWVGVLR
ncbi:MAG TPA: DMT family transporter [Anaerolineales bacterium]|nr:DMT family transporter [Anaerolineales bacterium]